MIDDSQASVQRDLKWADDAPFSARTGQRCSALVLGGGFLGLRLTKLLRAAGEAVLVTVRSPASESALNAAGVPACRLDSMRKASVDELLAKLCRVHIPATGLVVFDLIPPGPVQTGVAHWLTGHACLIAALAALPVRRAVLASSTRVYGNRNGGVVGADTPAMPDDARGRELLAAEEQWLASGAQARVVRLAGLYGPGRVIGMIGLRSGEPVRAQPDGLLNLLHGDDAARLLQIAGTSATAASVELGSDGIPIRRADYYGHMAKLLGVALRWQPQPGGMRVAASRACDPAMTCARTGWYPQHVDIRQELATLLHNL